MNQVLWQLTRFRRLGATQDKFVTFFILKIRSILMFGAVCYHSALIKELGHKLEIQTKKPATQGAGQTLPDATPPVG